MTTVKTPAVPPMIYKQMAKVMADVGAISKDRRNQSQGYNFRGIDDVYQAVQLVLAQHCVIPVPEVLEERSEWHTTKSGTQMIYRVLKIRHYFYAEDGSFIAPVVIGEGMDSGDKAANKAMSVGQKYAFLQCLCIPTQEAKDPENDSHEIAAPAAGKDNGKPKAEPHYGHVDVPDIYRGKLAAEQNRFMAIAKNYGVTQTVDLIAASKACEGLLISQLDAAIVEWRDRHP